MTPIAHIHSDLTGRFGVPRQSGLVPQLTAEVVLEPPYRDPQALRGIEGFSHLWLLWQFSALRRPGWSATVRPPRLGGNARVGVFASRSPYRPNPIGLSCVELKALRQDPLLGPVLTVAGVDLMDGTPVLDIKPYLPETDCRPTASGGFAQAVPWHPLAVERPPALLETLAPQRREALLQLLAQDPRPAYQDDPQRVYGLCYAGCEVRFFVREGRLTVCDIRRAPEGARSAAPEGARSAAPEGARSAAPESGDKKN